MEREIVNTLVSMYKTADNSERTELYNKLLEFASDKLGFLQTMLNIMKQDYDVNEKLSVSIFFKTFLNNLILKKEISGEDRRLIFMEMIQTDPSIMVHLTQCIESILFFDAADQLNTNHLLEELFKHMVEGVNTGTYNSDADRIRMFLGLFRVAVNVIQDTDTLTQKMTTHKDLLASVAEKSVDHLKTSFNNANQEEALMYSGLVHEFTVICKESTNKMGGDNRSSHIEYLTSDNFISLFRDIIFMGFPSSKIFFDSGDSTLNQKIYSAKTNMIKIVSQMITMIKPHLHMQSLTGTTFELLLRDCVSMFLSELLEFSAVENFQDTLLDNDLKNIVTALLTTSAQLAYIKDYHEEFKKHGNRLLTDIGFMYSMTMIEEKREMTDNPAEFVKIALDVCDRQKFIIMKSQAAKFIETIGDKVDQVFQQNCLLACDILEQAVMNDQNLENYAILKDHYEHSTFMRVSSTEDKIDVAIMMLTMSSYALPKDDNLKKRFIEVVEKVTMPIMNIKSLLLNCRLTIMLGYYMDILYKENDEDFWNLLDMFMSSLSGGEDCKALAIQSSDTLNTIINDNDIIPRIVPILPNLIHKVSECTMKVDIVEFFDFTSEIFKFYKDTMSREDFCMLFTHVVQRIILEINKIIGPDGAQSINPNKIKTSMSAQKCWHIIMSVIETPQYLEPYMDFMEEELKPIFRLLSTPDVIDFDDDVVKSMRIIINGTKTVSQTMKDLFPYLKNTFDKQKFIYTELFD
jgi:hypothetical protein